MSTLIHGLSDFWLRLFRDSRDLDAIYDGAEKLLGQAYLDLLSSVLNTSIVEAPLFRKQYYKLLTVNSSDITMVADGNSSFYEVNLGSVFAALPHVQNKVIAPTNTLVAGDDYSLHGDRIRFNANPAGRAGFATRRVDIPISGYFLMPHLEEGVQPGDRLYAYTKAFVDGPSTVDPGLATEAQIVAVNGAYLYLESNYKLPDQSVTYSYVIRRRTVSGTYVDLASDGATSGTFSAAAVVSVPETAYWVTDALADDQVLFENYGHYVGTEQRSSEAYRAFIRGVMQLYMFGPIIDRIEGALNVIAGLPLIRDDGEILAHYDSGLVASGTDGTINGATFTSPTITLESADVGGYLHLTSAEYGINNRTARIVAVLSANSATLDFAGFTAETGTLAWEFSRTDLQTVTTNRRSYSFNRYVPIRPDIAKTVNRGKLAFRAFEAMTLGAVVTDYIEDPEWWHSITIPKQLLPDWSVSRRAVSTALLPNVVGTQGNARAGDPGLLCGRDAEGNAVNQMGGLTDIVPYRHSASYVLMDEFLKLHMFEVRLDPSIDLTGTLISEMQALLGELKPAGSIMYFHPVTDFSDTVTIPADLLAIAWRLFKRDALETLNNQFIVGTSAFKVGDQFRLQDDPFVVDIGTGVGYTYAVVGGTDPTIVPTIGTPTITDRPLIVSSTEPL